ncbi:DNA-binding prophage protein [Proteus vulgaris]|uniref:hypothetical protein n=1 Tax=Proteus vulgaris TaxID=585 RepID=UPI000E02B2AD|nr:hypothetical protein [Proteus vulgaris]SUC18793.1 DNA-binding prophage protein [Proteus vulgaris]
MTNKIEKMKQNNIPACIDHDAELIKELREAPVYAEIYLQTALEGIYEPGGVGVRLASSHCIEKNKPESIVLIIPCVI